LPCQKGQTQGIRTDFGVAIVRGFRRRKGIGKALDDRVLGIPGRSRMLGVFGTTSKALGGNLEAGNAVNGVPDTPILCRDGKGNIEMYERQRDAVLRKAASEFRALQPTAIDSREVDRPEIDDMILGALRG
jgi:hypothetical protein